MFFLKKGMAMGNRAWHSAMLKGATENTIVKPECADKCLDVHADIYHCWTGNRLQAIADRQKQTI